jgi:valine--pyruvate aminotransferase
MKFSDFGQKFNRYSGITHLMDDLNQGLQQDDMVMLGGGNPAAIPGVLDELQATLDQLSARGDLIRALSNYDGPQGKQAFLETLADYLNERYDWGIDSRHIGLTHGSQSAFFALFNSYAGRSGGRRKHVLLPVTPEYIGYSDLGIEDGMFVSRDPDLEVLPGRFFKYHINFDGLDITPDTGLICVSRPTNPSGNVLTDAECMQLDDIARRNDVPLMVDNAYGTPFPHIVFNQVEPFWNDNTILALSLSKLGLPGVRTGVVIANPEVIRQLSNLTAVTSLAPGGVGPLIVTEMLKKNTLQHLSDEIIKPFYQQRCEFAVDHLKQAVTDERLRIHLPEGAFFLWLWFDGLSISTSELYQHLKKEGLLVVPGEYFFPGRPESSQHAHSCIRMNYAQSEQELLKGIEILARVVKRYW